jgi:hypothetical protein
VSCFTLSDTTAASMGEQACWLVLSDTHGAGLEAYLCRGTGFPGISGCGVIGHVAGVMWTSEFLHVLGSRTYLQAQRSEAMWKLQGQGIRSVELESFFPSFLWLVASLFMDSERALLLTGYRSSGCLLGSTDLPFSG